MKTMICIFLAAISLTGISYAGNETDICTKNTYPLEIGAMIRDQKPFFNEDLSGEVTIWFKVDEQNAIHVVAIESSNIYLKSHALEALEGRVMPSICIPGDEVYHITVDFTYTI